MSQILWFFFALVDNITMGDETDDQPTLVPQEVSFTNNTPTEPLLSKSDISLDTQEDLESKEDALQSPPTPEVIVETKPPMIILESYSRTDVQIALPQPQATILPYVDQTQLYQGQVVLAVPPQQPDALKNLYPLPRPK